MELLGKAIVVSEVIQVTDSFKKRELVIVTDEQYPQSIMIEFNQDKCDLLNTVAIGENLKVGINISGRAWVNPEGATKYFNSIKGWRIEKISNAQPQPQQLNNNVPVNNNTSISQENVEDDIDLPF